MLRRVTQRTIQRSVLRTAIPMCAATPFPLVTSQQRQLSFAGNLAAHFSSFSGALTGGSFLYTPLGTLALLVLTYNMCPIGLKHMWSTTELAARDYLQDTGLAQVMRYMLLWCLLVCVAQLFVEP